jgi:hypothetical protein
MKWLIVEDALRDRKGHWLEYVSTFVRGLKELGDEVVVLERTGMVLGNNVKKIFGNRGRFCLV